MSQCLVYFLSKYISIFFLLLHTIDVGASFTSKSFIPVDLVLTVFFFIRLAMVWIFCCYFSTFTHSSWLLDIFFSRERERIMLKASSKNHVVVSYQCQAQIAQHSKNKTRTMKKNRKIPNILLAKMYISRFISFGSANLRCQT